jgi:hypothetical protein
VTDQNQAESEALSETEDTLDEEPVKTEDDKVDEAGQDSFPASDPPSVP